MGRKRAFTNLEDPSLLIFFLKKSHRGQIGTPAASFDLDFGFYQKQNTKRTLA